MIDWNSHLSNYKAATLKFRLLSIAALLVRLDDAERLILATKEGRIQLVLRNPVDTRADKVQDATLQQLYQELPTNPPKSRKPRLKPVVLPMTDTPEIQIIEGNGFKTVECKDDRPCNPEQKAH